MVPSAKARLLSEESLDAEAERSLSNKATKGAEERQGDSTDTVSQCERDFGQKLLS